MKYQTYVDYRDKKGITDYRVAEDTGIDAPSLYRWKSGAAVPKLEIQAKISKYLGIPAELVLEVD